MRNIILIFGTFCLFTLASCSKSNRCDDLGCTGDCVFVAIDQQGEIHFYGCYNVWGVQFINDEEEQIIGLAPDMKAEYQVEDMEVTFSATFYENDIPLAFPDPMPWSFYRMGICDMNGDSN